jgi:hypothetical protein
MMPNQVVKSSLAALRARLQARAAGAWRVEGDRLEQVAFNPAHDLPIEVEEGFAAATRSVELSLVDLGIVRAALTAQVTVSLANELPADRGSGYWLRAFGATRSVAVPILGGDGKVALVVSIALGPGPSDEAVAGAILEAIEEIGGARE